MKKTFKDSIYDQFLIEPTKQNFTTLMKDNFGEMDGLDFKETWIIKGHLAKTILAMANSGGGMIVIGVKENADGTVEPKGLEAFEDKAKVNNGISKYISPNLDYEIWDLNYESPEYPKAKGNKYQIIYVHNQPERLPFISLGASDDIEKDALYIRRGTKCEKAAQEDIENILQTRMTSMYKDGTELSLDDHLKQLKMLYAELPKTIKVLIKKGEPAPFFKAISNWSSMDSILGGIPDEYEERENPNYPKETYEAFVLRMVNRKKLAIEKVLDLK